MKRKRSKIFRFGDWRIVTSNGKRFFFYRGKRKSAESGERALRSRLGSRKRKPVKSKKQSKKPESKPLRIRSGKFSLCRLKDRQDFYEQIVKDRKALRDVISEEDISGLRVDVDIGNATRRKTRKGQMSEQGYRRFRDLRKLRNFLGLNVKYDNAPDFSRTKGICRYRKVAYLTVAKMRGEREIGKRILRRYVYEPF